jgi:putative transposase
VRQVAQRYLPVRRFTVWQAARQPERVVIDGSQTNREAIVSCDTTNQLQDRRRRRLTPIRIRQSQYLTRAVLLRCLGRVLFCPGGRQRQCRVRPMLGFKSPATASIILDGIEMVHLMRKRQARYVFNPNPSLAEQFDLLAAA